MTTTASGCQMPLGTPLALLGKLSTLNMELVPALLLVPDLTLTLSGSKTPPPIWSSSPRSLRGLLVSGGDPCKTVKGKLISVASGRFLALHPHHHPLSDDPPVADFLPHQGEHLSSHISSHTKVYISSRTKVYISSNIHILPHQCNQEYTGMCTILVRGQSHLQIIHCTHWNLCYGSANT